MLKSTLNTILVLLPFCCLLVLGQLVLVQVNLVSHLWCIQVHSLAFLLGKSIVLASSLEELRKRLFVMY